MKKDKMISKEEILLIIQNYIRGIQMNDYGKDEGIHQLYDIMRLIEKL